MEAVIQFLYLGSKITVDSDCSHEVGALLFGRKIMTNLDSILKSRHHFAEIHIGKAVVFPVVLDVRVVG